MTTTTDFNVEVSSDPLGPNLPQKMGRRLWAPMFVMALMAFAVGFVLALVRAAEVAGDADPETLAGLGHLVPSFMFLGFMAAFASISFAIAKILSEFRTGGGAVQAATGSRVKTLKMPITARIFIVFMAMGMMIILAAVVLHWVAAAAIFGDSASALSNAEQWGVYLEGFRRLGVALYLFGITFGLGTIIHVLRFQAIRIRELPDQA